MVKGITRQVVVVKGPDPKLFDQAIFLVKDDVLLDGGITEDALLQEVRSACDNNRNMIPIRSRFLWAGCGAGVTGILWLLSLLL